MTRNEAIGIAKQAYRSFLYTGQANYNAVGGGYSTQVCVTDNHGSYVVVTGSGTIHRCPVRKTWAQ